MDQLVDLLDDFLRGVMSIASGVVGALGHTGSVMLMITATIGLIWIAGRTLRM